MPGVNAVAPRVQGGLLDTVLKGVQVARDYYGIKADMAKTDQLEQATDQAKTNFEDEQAGNFTPRETVALGKSYNFVPETTPNAQRIGRKGPDGEVQDAYILPKKEGSPLVSTVNDALVGGKHGTASYDLNTGGLLNFVETAKPDKGPATGKWAPVGFDAQGNPVSQNTTTGEYKTGDVGPVNKKGGTAPLAGAEAPPDPKAVAAERKQLADIILKSGSRSEVGRLRQKVDGAEALETLVANHPDFQINPSLQSELAMGVANLVSPGAATQSQIEHMDPQTRGTFTANLMQKLTNEPYSANNPAFVKSFLETITREKGAAQDQLGRTMAQAKYAAPNFFKADPKGFYGLIGMKPGDFNAEGGDFAYVPKVLGKTVAPEGPAGGSGTAIAAPAGAGGPVTEPLRSPMAPDTKTVDGVTYKKAPGGWKKVSP